MISVNNFCKVFSGKLTKLAGIISNPSKETIVCVFSQNERCFSGRWLPSPGVMLYYQVY